MTSIRSIRRSFLIPARLDRIGILIVLNFSRDEAAYSFPEGLKARGLLDIQPENLRGEYHSGKLEGMGGKNLPGMI